MIQIRPKGKAEKIAWEILGEPTNISAKKTPKQRIIDARLLREETVRVR